MMARGGGAQGKKTSMGQRIVAILPYIKQVLFYSILQTFAKNANYSKKLFYQIGSSIYRRSPL